MTDSAIERTLVLVKPDGVARGLTGEVVRRLEAKAYRLVALDMRLATAEVLAQHYVEHQGKAFYQPLVDFMLSGPVVAIVAQGERVVEGFRAMAGATDPTVAAPGTILGAEEHRARIGLTTVGRARDRPVVPVALIDEVTPQQSHQ